MERRTILKAGLFGAGCYFTGASQIAFGSVPEEVTPKLENGVAWYDVKDWGVEGRGWSDTKSYFDRLPAKAEKTVRKAVWGLSRHSAGMMARFESNTPNIHVRYRLTSSNLAMNHMPATGVSGVDLYGEFGNEVRWINVSRPSAQSVISHLARGIDVLPEKRNRKYQLYLPLYNGVETLEIGVQSKSDFVPVAPRKTNTILFYGTSIMHGACASRPGMCMSSIIGRRLNRPVINLGFSGNGKMETEVGDLICETKPSIIAIDCLPNMNAQLVKERTENLVKQIRKQLPDSPILLVEDRSFTNSSFFAARRKHHRDSRLELRAAYERLTKAGTTGLHYLSGENLLGKDGEGATDGSHPNDLGMVRYADAYEKSLRKIMG